MTAGAASEEVRQQVTIVNKRGLHARASAKFVTAVAAMDGCEVRVSKDGHSAAGRLDPRPDDARRGQGRYVELSVRGKKAEARWPKLVALLEDGFGED
jgi:phosphocarrier protein